MENNNIKTMEYIGEDNFSMLVFRCLENNTLYKGETIGDEKQPQELYSCGNEIDGDPGYPIDKDIEINFIGIPEQPTKEEKFNYMLLSRLQSDCDYYLGYGNRYAKHLWAEDEQKQIDKMKELYNSFSDDAKPEWLTMDQINEYEKEMIK